LIASPLSLHNMASRPVKRARTAPVVSQQPTASSKPKRERLFTPFRSLGHISTATPFVLQSRSSKYLEQPALTVITSLGSSWAMWEGQSLRLLFVGSSHLSPTSLLAYRRRLTAMRTYRSGHGQGDHLPRGAQRERLRCRRRLCRALCEGEGSRTLCGVAV
jgi:hypothetical protein